MRIIKDKMDLLKNKLELLLLLIFLGFTGWWISFQPVVENQGLSVQWFGGTYGLMALIGSIIGFVVARKWGGFKTVLGKALMFFSLGLLAQEMGQLIYTYYTYGAKIEIPYPSLGDIGYFGSIPLYIYGAVLLGKASGVSYSMKKSINRIQAFLIPSVLLVASYLVFLRGYEFDWSNPLTVFLDLGYPLGQAIYISLAITAYLLSRKLLGGIMRAGVLIVIFALVVQYLADWTFLYQISREIWIPGRFNDMFYLTAYFVMATAMVKFNMIFNSIQNPVSAISESQKAKAEEESTQQGQSNG